MIYVHVFVSKSRFSSRQKLREFYEPSYSEEGDMVPSSFMREVTLKGYEPAAIEAVHFDTARNVAELLRGVSYAGQWVPRVRSDLSANCAICLFCPNVPMTPERSSLKYLGRFECDAQR
ncbi:hypothetical protein GCM10027159_14160 [Lysobacter terrae]